MQRYRVRLNFCLYTYKNKFYKINVKNYVVNLKWRKSNWKRTKISCDVREIVSNFTSIIYVYTNLTETHIPYVLYFYQKKKNPISVEHGEENLRRIYLRY